MKSFRAHDMKRFNRISVIRAIQAGAMSRAAIAISVGLSKPAVSAIVDELIRGGWVRETGQGQSTEAGGKRPILLQFNYGKAYIAAGYWNLHSNEIEAAITDLAGEIIEARTRTIPMHSDYRLSLDEVTEHIRDLIDAIGEQGRPQPIEAFSLAISGLIDTEKGILKYTAARPEWRDIPVKAYMEAGLHIPVYVENDARASALTELQLESTLKDQTFACIQVDHGVGTGLVIAGQVYRGTTYGTVTFAHTTILHGGPACKCGKQGCWEALVSLDAFLKELKKRDPRLAPIGIEEAIRMYRQGHTGVRDVLLNFTGYWLGAGIANLLNVFNPGAVVIQGKLTETDEPFLTKVRTVALELATPGVREADIHFSKAKERVQVRGAAHVVIQDLFSY